jgi:tetratricopeptide (TPR) repeat protein
MTIQRGLLMIGTMTAVVAAEIPAQSWVGSPPVFALASPRARAAECEWDSLQEPSSDIPTPATWATTGGGPRQDNFSRFLLDAGETELWLDDLLARWRALDSMPKTTDASTEEAVDPHEIVVGKLEIGFEIGRWLDAELARVGDQALRERYPQLGSGPQALQPEFACVRLILMQPILKAWGLRAFEQGLRGPLPNNPTEELRDRQRELRGLVDDFARLANQIDERKSPGAVWRLRQWQASAEANLAWAFYYEWLLGPTQAEQPTRPLELAYPIFMRRLGVTEPDLASSEVLRWFDPSQPSAVDHLLGLGLSAAGQGQWSKANACFATLQQQGDPDLAQRVILWQVQNELKQGRWDDARLLATTYLQNLRAPDDDIAAGTVDRMLAWFVDPSTDSDARGPVVGPTAPTDGAPPTPAAVWSWRLVEQLVQRGQIDQATALLNRYPIRWPETGLASQVLRLNQLLTRQSGESRSREQWGSLANALERWASPAQAPPGDGPKVPAVIQRWAKRWLSEAKWAMGDWTGALRAMEELHGETPSEARAERQQIAWRLAQWYETRSQWDESSRQSRLAWYRQAATMTDLPLSAAAEIQVRLSELADQPWAQDAYLKSIPASDPGFVVAQQQRLSRLYERFLAEPPDSMRQVDLAAELQSLVGQMLALPPLPDAGDVDRWTSWQDQLRAELTRSQTRGDVAGTAAMLLVWLKTLEAIDQPDNRRSRENLLAAVSRHCQALPPHETREWTVLLLAAVVFWGQDPHASVEPELQQATVERLLGSALTAQQTQVVLSHAVPALDRRWRQREDVANLTWQGEPRLQQEPLTRELTRLYRKWWSLLQQAEDVDQKSAWVAHVGLRWADVLWRQGAYEEAHQVLIACPELQDDMAYQQQMARILSCLGNHDTAELWLRIAAHFPNGSGPWFEAKWHLLNREAKLDPAAAKSQYQQMGQLYPEVPGPWAGPWREMGRSQGW